MTLAKWHVTATDALARLPTPEARRFATVLSHGTLSVEIYAPRGTDLQKPHTRDEVYVIVAGRGEFLLEKERRSFGPGDVLFAPAHSVHRFEGFSDDFATWVFFYGPEGARRRSPRPDAPSAGPGGELRGMAAGPLRLSETMSEGSVARWTVPLLLVLSALAGGSRALAADDGTRPLPDTRSFLEAVRSSLHSDQTLLSEYTFMEKHVETKLDAKGGVKSSKTEVYEVYPSSKPGRIYRRLVMSNGVPVDPKDLAVEDRKHDEKMEKRRLEQENETPEQKERRLQKDEEDQRREKQVVEELFQMDEIRVVGRETLDGRTTILLTFQPRPGYRPQTRGGKVLQKLSGKAWIDEQEHQLVRIDAELLEPLGVGPGGVFRLQKGAQAFFQRRRVNDEIWLPAEARFVGAAKVLLFVLGRLDARSQYSDYHKFSVSTATEIGGVAKTND